MASLGEELRRARELRRLSIPDISEQIHIRSVYLQAIEEERWSVIAAPVYVRGFIRSYARFLGLDGEDLVSRFNDDYAEPPPAERPDPMFIRRRRRPAVWAWPLGIFAAAAVLFVGYDYYRLQKTMQAAIIAEVGSTAAPRSMPSAAARSREKGAPEAPGKGLVVRMTERSWIRVMVDGRTVMEGVFEPGTRRVFEGESATVRAGNAGGVEIMLNGKAEGKLGPQGGMGQRTFVLLKHASRGVLRFIGGQEHPSRPMKCMVIHDSACLDAHGLRESAVLRG